MSNRGEFIPRGRDDERCLNAATEQVGKDIKNKFIFKIPSNWDIVCGDRKLLFKNIKEVLIEKGMPPILAEDYYGGQNGIETDGHIIYLVINQDGKIIKKPLYMGEMKKQGTNGNRLKDGKGKQAQGNAAGDRMAKNYNIASDYCYLCDNEFFPYNVYMHGYDFTDNEITTTTKSKLQPFFGKLNNLNPWFDKNAMALMSSKKGGSCFYQGNDFTFEQLYDYCYKCCEIGINHYLKKYGITK